MSESMDDVPERIKADVLRLYEAAATGRVSVEDFLRELGELGIQDFSQAMHASDAFKISLNDAKTAFIESLPGGTPAWEAQFENTDLSGDEAGG